MDTAKFFIFDAGADINSGVPHNISLFQYACRNNNIDMIKLLVDAQLQEDPKSVETMIQSNVVLQDVFAQLKTMVISVADVERPIDRQRVNTWDVQHLLECICKRLKSTIIAGSYLEYSSTNTTNSYCMVAHLEEMQKQCKTLPNGFFIRIVQPALFFKTWKSNMIFASNVIFEFK